MAPPDIRASDDERERTVDALRVHAAAGRLDAGELEERLGLALAAKTRADLDRLLDDLPTEPPRPAPRAVRPVHAHAHGCGAWGRDPRRLVPIAVLLVAIWALTGAGYFWPIWPLLGFAVSVLMHRRGSNTSVIGNTRAIGNARVIR